MRGMFESETWIMTPEQQAIDICAHMGIEETHEDYEEWVMRIRNAIDRFIETSVLKFLSHTRKITLADLEVGHGKNYLLRNTMEELGEYCAAVTITKGIKKKPLKETPQQEAVDLIICALSLFYAEGGTDEELAEYGLKKLKKWADRIPSYKKKKKKK